MQCLVSDRVTILGGFACLYYGSVMDPFESSWLRNLSPQAIDGLRERCSLVPFPSGSCIYRIGLNQDSLWGVLDGQVRVLVATNELPPVLGHIHAPGAWFGEVEFTLSHPAYVEMQAAGDTRLYRIEHSAFRDLSQQHPQLWESVARLACLNLWLTTAAANDLVLRTAEMRIAAVLLRLSGHRSAIQGSPPLTTVHANQQEIASLANVARTTASKTLQKFREQGAIGLDYGRVSMIRPQQLEQLLDE